jgi:hypothetical protein
MSVRKSVFAEKTQPPSVRRLSTSLCAAVGKHSEAKVRLNPCAVAHLRRRVATGTDFKGAPNEIGPVINHIKSAVTEALSDGELSPREVAGLYEYVSKSTQLLADELDEPESPDWMNDTYLDFMSDRDLAMKRKVAAVAARRKRVIKGIQVLTSMTMAGGLLYALINTADQTEPLIPDKSLADKMADFAFWAANIKMS